MTPVKTKRSKISNPTSGHRERLRDRFLAANYESFDDRRTLELLLTYAIPRRDVLPIADALLARFGSVSAVLRATPDELRAVAGVGEASVLLMKIVERLAAAAQPTVTPKRRGTAVSAVDSSLSAPPAAAKPPAIPSPPTETQQPRSDPPSPQPTEVGPSVRRARPGRALRRPRTGLFSNGLLKDAVKCLPDLPQTESVEVVATYLRNGGLHYSGAQTRQRFASYITARLFPAGEVDRAIRLFAERFEGRQELRDVVFYRFMKAEPLLERIVLDLLLPSTSTGLLPRARLRQFLTNKFPDAKQNAARSCGWAVADILGAAGLATVARDRFSAALRDICPESFAFILHSEFPEPGMFELRRVEQGDAFRAMLWRPDAILPAMYELRNRGWISKISEIDTVRQFTTRFTLDQVVERVVGDGGGR